MWSVTSSTTIARAFHRASSPRVVRLTNAFDDSDLVVAAIRAGAGGIMLKDVSLEDPTGSAGEVPTAALMAKQARLQGLIVGSRREQQDFVRALDASGIRPVVDRRFPLVICLKARLPDWRSFTSPIGLLASHKRQDP